MSPALRFASLCLVLSACGGGAPANAEDPPSAVASALASDDEAAPLRLAAASGGVARTTASAATDTCQPTAQADFVDTLSWTYRRVEPADCQTLGVATPVFVWPQPVDRNTALPWSFSLRRPGGAVLVTRSSARPRLLLTDIALAPGSYEWQVAYRDRAGRAQTSAWRRFSVASGAIRLPAASAVAAQAAAKAAPRLLPAGATLSGLLRQMSSGEYNIAWAEYGAQADRDARRASALRSAQAAGRPLAPAVSEDAQAMEVLATQALFVGSPAYRELALERLMALVALPPNGETGEARDDQTNRQVLLALAKGYSLLGGSLDATQRRQLVAAAGERLNAILASFATLDGMPYDSHKLAAVPVLTEALLHLAGTPDFPQAQAQLAQAWELAIGTFGSWGGRDGGFGNSNAYAWYNLQWIRMLATARLVAGVDLSAWEPVRRAGAYLMAFTPADTRLRSPFGDDAENSTLYDAYSFDDLRLYAALVRDPAHEWYWRAKASNVRLSSVMSPLHFYLLGLVPLRAGPRAPTATLAAFPDAGLVAMHSSATDPARSSLYFRSSRLGALNHSHADQNSLLLVSGGRDLLISAGHYPYFASPHHLAVTRATRFKNALSFDGGIGQSEPLPAPTQPGAPVFSADSRGALTGWGSSGDWQYAMGDATLAYRGRESDGERWRPLLTRALRGVAYNAKERVAVVLDWAASPVPRRWELNYHALEPFVVNAGVLKASNGGASACLEVLGPATTVATSSGFPIAPENGAADHHHARFSTASATQLAAVTVIREGCRPVPVQASLDPATGRAVLSANGGAALTLVLTPDPLGAAATAARSGAAR